MRRTLVICLLLSAATAAVYAPVLGYPFIRFDDDRYVLDNPHVRQGLTREGIVWALTTFDVHNWQPLTWLSHMLDCELFGLRPGAHHGTNLLLHAANASILFLALRSLTGARGRSAVVAALFALHPLHVESVAWIAERKDLLSALFGLLALWAYAAHARRPGAGRYALTLLLLALGLMAKPMLVSLPLLFLLLDLWPLGRGAPGERRPWALPAPVLAEKLPLLALSLGSGALTLMAQSATALQDTATLPLAARAANAVVSYARYLGKTLWPVDLAVLYPHPSLAGGAGWGAGPVVASALLLAAISWGVWRSRRGYLLVGWLWYLVSLAPVIGLVQVGLQAMADRYTYLPLIGPFVALVWGAAELAERRGRPATRRLGAGLAAIVLAACAAGTVRQVRFWRHSIPLFERSLAVAPGSALIHNNLGIALGVEGRLDAAAGQFRRALEIDPSQSEAHFNLGVALLGLGRPAQALEHLETAVRDHPDHPGAHERLADALLALGRTEEATSHRRRAAALRGRP